MLQNQFSFFSTEKRQHPPPCSSGVVSTKQAMDFVFQFIFIGIKISPKFAIADMQLKIESRELSDLLLSYISQLQLLESQIQQKNNPLLKVLLARVNLTTQTFEAKLSQITDCSHTASLKLKKYFTDTFDNLQKDSYRMMYHGNDSNKLTRFKQFERELTGEWEFEAKPNTLPHEFKKIGTQMVLQDDIEKTRLIPLAKDYLQQQFFAIRLLSYQMYEQYSGHQHPATHHRIVEAEQEQHRLSLLIAQAKHDSLTIANEEKRLRHQLDEIKQVNQVLLRRTTGAFQQPK